MTTRYIRLGKKRPVHLLSDDGETAVCGAISRGDAEAWVMAVGPDELSNYSVCRACLAQRAAAAAEGMTLDEALAHLRGVRRIE